MDWFLYDNCLRHERVNIVENFFTNLMNFILEEEDVEYYKHDRNIPIYGYTVPIRMNETMTFVLK